MAVEGQRRARRPGQRDELAHDVHDLQARERCRSAARRDLEPIARFALPVAPRTASSCRPAIRPRMGNSDSASSPTDPDQREDQIRWRADDQSRGTRMTSWPAGPWAPLGTPIPIAASPPAPVIHMRVQTLCRLVDRCARQRRVQQEISRQIPLIDAGVDVEPHRRRLHERLRQLAFSIGLDEMPEEPQGREQPSRSLPLVAHDLIRGSEIGFDDRPRQLRPRLGVPARPNRSPPIGQQARGMTQSAPSGAVETLICLSPPRSELIWAVPRPARRATPGGPPANLQSAVRGPWPSPDRRASAWRREPRLPDQTGSGPARAAARAQWTTSIPGNAAESWWMSCGNPATSVSRNCKATATVRENFVSGENVFLHSV